MRVETDRLRLRHGDRAGIRRIGADGGLGLLERRDRVPIRDRRLTVRFGRRPELGLGQAVDREAIRRFVEGLDLSEADRERLLALTPADYVGMAARIVDLLQ